jgi:hypothetical protein
VGRRGDGLRRSSGKDSDLYPVKMQLISATRPFSPLVILGSVGLSVCVFAWGLQYKLSLYDPSQEASLKIPQAKLLSENERSVIAESPLAVQTKPFTSVCRTVPAAVFFHPMPAPRILNSQASSQREQRTGHSWHIRRGLLNTFFVRPPPIPT